MQQAYTAFISFYVIARSVSFGNDRDRLIEISESMGVFPLSLICMNETRLKSLAKSCVIYGIPPSLLEKCIFPLLRNARIQCRMLQGMPVHPFTLEFVQFGDLCKPCLDPFLSYF